MKFIELTGVAPEKFYRVNADKIIYIQLTGTGSYISFGDPDESIFVSETPEQIINRINND